MQNILETKNISAYRGSTLAISNLSLSIPFNCNTAILGPNGSGKSTLLMLISREIYPLCQDGGYLKLFGKKNWNVWDLRNRLGIVSQDLQNYYLQNAKGEDVVLSGFYSSINIWKHQHFSAKDREMAKKTINLLGISRLKHRKFADLSTGEQRLFLLARALVNNPQVLLLDEPTSGMDLKACFNYLQTVRDLIKLGHTIILVTHHIHEIPPEVTKLVFLKNGSVFAQGEKKDLMREKMLRNLYDCPLQLVCQNGFYQAMPD
mgnify:CR=1 FL=1